MSRRLLILLALACGAPAPVHAQVARSPARPTDSAPLTVGTAVAEALAASPALRADRARAEGERAAAPAAGRLPNPTLSWLGEGLRANPPTTLQPDHAVSVTQSLPLGGRLRAERQLAGAVATTAARAADGLAETIAIETVGLFVDAVRTGEALVVVADQRRELDALVTIQRRRVEEGVATTGDLGRLQAELARAQLHAARLGIDARRARLALCMALGRADCEGWTPVLPDAAWLASPAGISALAIDPALISARIDARPAVQAALARQEEARFAKAVADASIWPSLDITGGYKRTQFLDTGMAGVSVTLPLFDRQQLPRLRADAALGAAALDVDQARREARLQVEQAAAMATALVEQAQTADLTAPALVSQRAVRGAFREGAIDLLRLVDAERLVTDTRLDQLHLTLDALLATLQARVLIGLPLP